MIVVILHDIFAGLFIGYFELRSPTATKLPEVLVVFRAVFGATSSLTLVVSGLEVLARLALAPQLGLSARRILDMLLVVGLVVGGLVYGHKGLLILSLFRLWRFLEHEEVVVAAVREEVVEANVAFELEKRKRENLEALVNQLKSKLQWESEARERAEDQIRQYKDENFTLMEMIQVAAEDHARLGGDASADGEDDDDDVTGGAGLGFPRPAAGSSAGGQSDGASTSDADGVRAASQRAHKRVVVAKDGSVMKL